MTWHGETATTAALFAELHRLRRRVAELEACEAKTTSHAVISAPHFPTPVFSAAVEDAPEGAVREDAGVLAARLREAEENAQLGSWRLDLATNEFHWSDQMFSLYDLPPTTRPSIQAFLTRVHPDDRVQMHSGFQTLLASNSERGQVEYRVICSGGELRHMLVIGTVVRTREGEPLYVTGTAQDVTETKRMMRAFKDSEARLRSLFDNIPASILSVDREERILFINRTLDGLTGEQAVGRPVSEFLPPQAAETMVAAIRSVFETGQPRQLEIHGAGPTGRTAWYECRLAPICGETGIVAAILVATDVTEARQASAQICLQSQLLDSVQESVMATDLQGKLTYWGRGAARLYGYRAAEVLGKSISFVSSDVPLDQRGDRSSRLRLHRLSRGQYQKRRRDGSLFYADSVTSPVKDQTGAAAGFITIDRDVTDRVRAEREVARSEARFRTLIEHSYDVINLFSAEGVLLYASPSLRRVLGYDPEERIGQAGLDIVHPDVFPKAARDFSECLHNPGQVIQFTYQLRHKNGSYRTVEGTESNLLYAPGVNAMVSIFRDVTDRKAAESQLQMTQFAVDHSRSMFIRIDREARIRYVNEAACRNLSYSRGELLAMDFGDIDPSWPHSRWEIGWHNLEQVGSSTFESTHRRKDGSLFPVEITANHVKFDGDEFLFTCSLDISARKEAEWRLREAESQLAHVARLSTVGEMVAGIAHEINQPLHAIGTLAAACRNALGNGNISPAQLSNWLNDLMRASIQAGDIVTRLKRFTRRTDTHCVPVSLNQLVTAAEKLVRFDAERQSITLHLEKSPANPVVKVDSVQIQQVLVNLLVNAIEAIQHATPPVRKIVVHVTTDSDCAKVEVIDSGPGLAKKASRLFEPFVTTKRNGLGLGLAISHSIIQSHQGTLHGFTRPEGGATFEFSLPLDECGGSYVK